MIAKDKNKIVRRFGINETTLYVYGLESLISAADWANVYIKKESASHKAAGGISFIASRSRFDQEISCLHYASRQSCSPGGWI